MSNSFSKKKSYEPTTLTDTETDETDVDTFEFSLDGSGVTKPGLRIGQVNPAPGHIKGADGKPARGGETEIHVYPMSTIEETTFTTEYGTYDGYLDSVNVQWAVDNVAVGGTVKLMTGPGGSNKVFFFGNEATGKRDYVLITRGITVAGEKLGADSAFELPDGSTVNSDRAMIYGGGASLANLNSYMAGVLTVEANAKVTVKDIRFDNFGGTAIFLGTCNGAEVTGNKITNVVPIFQPDPSANAYFGIGIQANNMVSGSLAGVITIENNDIDLFGPTVSGPPYTKTLSVGINVGDTSSSATAYIKNNVIKNPGTFGVWLAGYKNVEVFVDNNQIYQRADNPRTTFSWSSGVGCSTHFGVGVGKTHITNNTIDGTMIGFANPIYILGGSGHEILNNTVTNIRGLGTALFLRDVSSSTVKNNKLTGTATRGIQVTRTLSNTSINNTIYVGLNDLKNLIIFPITSTTGHVVLNAGANNNKVEYPLADNLLIRNFGLDNQIIGY